MYCLATHMSWRLFSNHEGEKNLSLIDQKKCFAIICYIAEIRAISWPDSKQSWQLARLHGVPIYLQTISCLVLFCRI